MSQFFASSGQSTGVSASTSVLPMNTQDCISFRMDWLDLLAVQGTLKSLLQHHSSKASIPQCSAFFVKSNSHMTTGKTIALTRRTFVGKSNYTPIQKRRSVSVQMASFLPTWTGILGWISLSFLPCLSVLRPPTRSLPRGFRGCIKPMADTPCAHQYFHLSLIWPPGSSSQPHDPTVDNETQAKMVCVTSRQESLDS